MGSAALPSVLHVAAMWGTNILTFRHLERGESFDEDAFPMPDGLDISASPIRAADGKWEVDARGAIAGKLRLRGRDEEVVAMDAPFTVGKGDYGLLQYGQFGIFFQCGDKPVLQAPERTPELLVAIALLSSGALHVGALGFLRALMTPPPIVKPIELATPDDFARRFGLRRALVVPPRAGSEGGEDKSEPAASAGGGTKTETHGVAEGKRGPSTSGHAPRNVVDLLRGETGQDIQRTLGSLPSVEDALGATTQHVIGDGHGLGLRGNGDDGVRGMPGTREIHTGWGAPPSGSYGIGTGAPPPRETRLHSVIEPPNPHRLDPEQIRRVVFLHHNALRACYDTELVRNATARGGVTVSWTIDAGGTVSNASVVGSTIHSPRVEGCVVRQVKSWRFPASDGPTNVAAYPFVFGVGG